MSEHPPVDPVQLGAYFALIEVTSLLRYAIEQQLSEEGDLTFVQFQILARLSSSPTGNHSMTDLADQIVYSRSGMTYQVGQLDKAGLVTRTPSPDDERSIMVALTDAGHRLVARVFPGHVEVVTQLLFEPLSQDDAMALARILTPVRDHMRSIPPRSASPRRHKRAR